VCGIAPAWISQSAARVGVCIEPAVAEDEENGQGACGADFCSDYSG
jgi:hypothetical protein